MSEMHGAGRRRGIDILNRLDLNLLIVFEAVYTERGVSRAAERLFLSQSAVSHALGRLREILKDPLFARDGKSMIPNSTADQLIGPIRSALAMVKMSFEGLNTFDPATSSRQFTIGVRGFAESLVIPRLITAMRCVAPNITLRAMSYERVSLGTLLKSTAIDVAIDAFFSQDEAIATERLGTFGFVAMLRDGHPALSCRLDLSRYLSLEHVVASLRPSGLGLEDAVLRGLIRGRRVGLRCQNYTTAAHAATTTDMVLTVPQPFARILAGQAGLTYVPIFEESRFAYAMYSDRDGSGNAAVAWLRGLIRDCARGINDEDDMGLAAMEDGRQQLVRDANRGVNPPSVVHDEVA